MAEENLVRREKRNEKDRAIRELKNTDEQVCNK